MNIDGTRAMRVDRALSNAIVVAIAGFSGLIVVAMAIYPGGNGWDRAAPGNDFWLNFLCDLERRVALDGKPNCVGSVLTQVAMLWLAGGLLALFWRLGRIFRARPRVAAAVRWLGGASVTGAAAVALMPADRFGDAHGLAIVIGGVPGLAAALVSVVEMRRHEAAPRITTRIGVVMLVVSCADFALYVRQLFGEDPGPRALAILERASLILILVWMALVARRRERVSQEDRKIRRSSA